MSIREAVDRISSTDAKRYAREYFAPHKTFTSSRHYTGSHFEEIAADQNERDRITAADLLAVQNLAVRVPARAAIGILGDLSSSLTDLLAQIPDSIDLASVTAADHESTLGKESPAKQLWDLLRQTGGKRWGIGPTIASKIMARKRPRLIPIEDKVVNRVIKLGSHKSWQLWREALRVDGGLEARADEVRDHVGHPELSTLRALDIVLWKYGKEHSKV